LTFRKLSIRLIIAYFLKKISTFGIHGHFSNWLWSYLNCRTQAVKGSQSISPYFPVSSGVPQGSHLGPLLFIMFINDLLSIFDNTVDILLFADDAKIFSTTYSPSDALNLQDNLDKFVIWTHQNSLSLNINKCNVITFSRIENPISFDYKIDNCSVTRATSIRDSGIIIDSNLSFTTHINTITKKSFKMLGFINRNTVNFKNINALKILFFALVRSHLEFGSIVWSPSYITFINTIENVQLKFLKLLCYKFIPLISKISYNMRMSELSFISCEVRRKIANIMFIYDLLNGHIFSPDLLSMIAFNTANHCLRKSNLFHVPFYNNNYSSTSYFPRALKLSNPVVDHVDFFFMSRNVFKRNVLNDVVN